MQPQDLLPGGPTAIWQAIKAIQRELREQRASRRGEGIGRLRATTAAGVPLVETGPAPWNHIDGSTQEGIRLYREDGSLVAAVEGQPSVTGSDRQYLAIYDRGGNIVLSDDFVGTGLARPYLPFSFGRANYLSWEATSSGSYADIHLTVIEKQAPMAYLVIAHTNDVSGATGSVRVTANGVAVGSPISTIFNVALTTVGPFELPGAHMATVELRVQAMRSTGTGNVRCEVIHASQIES
ncbi:hypothetical protein ACIPY6_28795 [Streptomyces sp. NPDC090054]|uniref:hypothetical protein n=1 Tax=Streptomyces sp. NPDC090054 TaxID=3365933 RepID=UPI0038063B5F